MKVSVIVKLQVEGLHNFPDAKEIFPEVGFLADTHRHMFHITASKAVTHSDRDVEFILFRRQILLFLSKYKNVYDVMMFGKMSCEMIAEEILKEFDCEYVEVFEDGENGSRCEKTDN